MPAGRYPFQPYCGQPPDPVDLLERWNLDPLLIAALVALLATYWIARRDETPWRRATFVAGWSAGALALISPLCPLSVSLFSARVGQHMILTTVAAPLLALGRPFPVRTPGSGAWDLAAAAAFGGLLWLWHAPGPYAATFNGDLVYWTMHLTLFGSALWLWSRLFDQPERRLGATLAAALITTLQMGFLGAIITLGSRPLYAPHILTTAAWGFSPLQDQQLGGVVMWIPAGVIFLAAILAPVAVALRRAEARSLAQARA
jgi:putative membrane protein